MRKYLIVLGVLFALASAQASAAKHSFQTGKLLSVTTDEHFIDGTGYRRAILTVQVGDLVYTLRGDRVHTRGNDYAKGLIIGDPVQVSVEGENIYLLKPDGKDMKTAILKRERVPAAAQ